MRLTFLGGADEVGASCLLVEAVGVRVLVDCGIRLSGGDRLPDLAPIGRAAGLDAIVLTHAHLDHTGAVPLVHATAQDVPVLATAATLDLVAVLLRDASKLMECGREEEVPLYPPEAVDAVLAHARPVPFLEPVPLGTGSVTATFVPAGHVLGAAQILFSTPEGTLLVTGDVSVTPQRTVPGLLPPRQRPDVVVCEATYGGRLHANRAAEESRLIEAVAERVAAGGKVLIPAFALGRAQEVMLVLERAVREGRLPAVPVWVDGMVRSICSVYGRHVDLLQPALRKRAQKRDQDPLFGAGDVVRAVTRAEQRDEIVAGPPCVIVASSGMLTGGPSVWYAARLLSTPGNLVAMTGYQDEEAPGRRLLEVAEGSARQLVLEGRPVPVAARATRYALSAHADEGELTAYLSALRPRDLCLVHGAAEARASLARAAGAVVRDEVRLPALGDVVELCYGRSGSAGRAAGPAVGLGAGAPLDDAGLERLRGHLLGRHGERRSFTTGDLLRAWYGRGWGQPEREALHGRLAGGVPGFEPDRKRPFLFRMAEPSAAPPPSSALPLDQTAAVAAARAAFGAAEGLLRAGVDLAGRLVLTFDFPDVAAARHAERLAALSARTGREVAVHPEANLQALCARAAAALPAGLRPAQNPSFSRELRTVALRVAGLGSWSPVEAAERFRADTGFALEVRGVAGTPATSAWRWDAGGRLEANQALGFVRAGLAAERHQPRRVSRKTAPGQDYLEVSFVSPAVGERYRALLERLAAEAGWELRVAASVDQQAIIAAARALLAPRFALRSGPGVHLARSAVRVALEPEPSPDEAAALSARLLEETGFSFEVERVRRTS